MGVSIQEKIINPIEALFKRVLLIIFGLAVVSTAYQVTSNRKSTHSFLATFIGKISRSADIEGNLVFLQKEIEQLTSSLRVAGVNGGHILVTLNGKVAAESGERPLQFSKITVKQENFLPSGNQIGVQIEIDIFQILRRELVWFLFVFITLSIFFLVVRFRVKTSLSQIASPIKDLALSISVLDDSSRDNPFNTSNNSGIMEIRQLYVCFYDFLNRIRDREMQIVVLQRKELFAMLAAQVSHDIRSPLSALNMVIGQLKEIPENHRLIIRESVNRINDIANQLLEKGREAKHQELVGQASPMQLSVQLLSPLVDSIVSEKRVQFRERQNIRIEANIHQAYGVFANINATELKRIISNLVNNSVEAITDATGTISVAVKKQDGDARIVIRDNGCGMSQGILEKIGEAGISYGKKGNDAGSGLGIFHAKKTVESFGGRLQIESAENVGTTITLSFPLAKAPEWFVEKIIFKPKMKIVSVDDDQSTHGIWRGRLESQKTAEHGIEYFTFTSGEDFRRWYAQEAAGLGADGKYLFLMDYELLAQNKNGLDLIEGMGLSPNAILVTSRYEEKEIRERCERANVKLIPKPMAAFVPMEIAEGCVVAGRALDAILIDDDSMMHQIWGLGAKQFKKNVRCFFTVDDFLREYRAGREESPQGISFETPIYIDSNLANGVKGEVVSEDLYKMGFKNIYLTTGYQPSHFSPMMWIKGIIGKELPWKR